MRNKKPNLFLIGAQKSATTSLATTLNTHSNVYLPRQKEPFFFCREEEVKKGIEYYVDKYYDEVSGEKWKMDASTSYMVSASARSQIRSYDDDEVKFILILRHPVDRVQSALTFRLNKHESPDTRGIKEIRPSKKKMHNMCLEDLLEWEKRNVENKHLSKREKRCWRDSGFPFRLFYVSSYSKHIKKWFCNFDREKFLFVKFDNFVNEKDKVIEKLADFLKIESERYFSQKEVKQNKTKGYPKKFARVRKITKNFLKSFIPNKVQKYMVKAENKIWNKKEVSYEFEKEAYLQINKLFDGEIRKTSDLTGLDLTDWLSENRCR